jgi:hypothetical protein
MKSHSALPPILLDSSFMEASHISRVGYSVKGKLKGRARNSGTSIATWKSRQGPYTDGGDRTRACQPPSSLAEFLLIELVEKYSMRTDSQINDGMTDTISNAIAPNSKLTLTQKGGQLCEG